jgi:hypothetical protein
LGKEAALKRAIGAFALTAVAMFSLAGTAQAHRATCVETTNPHGSNVPPAGFTTSPGTNPHSGQNPDGFYLLGTNTGVDSVWVKDGGSGRVFGPFAPGTKIKYTQAQGATPSIKKIGSTNGRAGAVLFHITGTGDAFVFSGDHVLVPCRVPPPPK